MNKYEWKQTIFKPEDFEGSGQYIVREGHNKENSPHITDTGYLTSVMMKVGYFVGNRDLENKEYDQYCLIDVSDGMVITGYYNGPIQNGVPLSEQNREWISFSGESSYEAKQKICDFLNNNPHNKTYRKATNEELIRVAAYQKLRTV